MVADAGNRGPQQTRFWFAGVEDRIRLERLYVLCLPALRSFDDIELDGLPFLQAAEAFALNR